MAAIQDLRLPEQRSRREIVPEGKGPWAVEVNPECWALGETASAADNCLETERVQVEVMVAGKAS